MVSRSSIIVVGLTTMLFAGHSRADDVTDQINEAMKAYAKHDLATASAALDAAGNLIRQAKGDSWKAMLPEPLPGWTAADAESTVMGAAMLGGAISVSRQYKKGSQSVEVSFVADAPMMQGLASLMGSGLMNSGDNRLVVLDGRKFTYMKSDNSYTTMVGKVLVSVKGRSVEDTDLRAYLKQLHFAELEKAAAG